MSYGLRIANDELVLRSAVMEDAAQLGKWWRDGDVMAHAGFPNGFDIEDEDIAAQIERGDGRLIVEISGKPVGEMSYRDIGENAAEIGIKICDKTARGKGYGTKFLQMLIGWLFDNGFERIALDTNVKNIVAQRTYEGLGFKKVRTNIDAWKDQLGVLQSSIDYELIKR
ncbi:MAG: GNAT family N-acetyltransferase [Defluviitaleaceae bacterium]|nr:GNAT family N-acetyltransferase [Defluviitaleaceae bacterium]